MMAAFERNYVHRSKRVPWGGSSLHVYIDELGVNLTGAAFVWAFAATEGGSPVITLNAASAGSQGVSVTYDANMVNPWTGEVVGGSRILPQIDEATLEALTWGGDPAAPLILRHNLLITPSGGAQYIRCFGNLTIYPGVGD